MTTIRQFTDEEVESILSVPKAQILTKLVNEVLELFLGNHADTIKWFQTPIRALDNTTPQQRILNGEYTMVQNLVEEMNGGFSY